LSFPKVDPMSFDRLYAVTAHGLDTAKSYNLYWRTATAGPHLNPRMLFWRRRDGGVDLAIGEMTGHGNYSNLTDGRWANTFLTHIVAIGPGMLFLYDNNRCNASVVGVDDSGNVSIVRQYAGSFSPWTSVVSRPAGFAGLDTFRVSGRAEQRALPRCRYEDDQ